MEKVDFCGGKELILGQDGSLAVDHEHDSEFVSTRLDAPGAALPGDPQCKPQAKQEAGEMKRGHDAKLASLFSKTEIMVFRFYQNGRLSQK